MPIAPRHVCLLFRRFRSFETDVTHGYVRALEARHLPHVLVGGSAFHEREEVEALRNALAAIERPDDELAVFATLARAVLRARRRRAARVPRALRDPAPLPPPARRRCRPGLAEVGDGDGGAARAAPRAQPPADRRHDRAAPGRDPRAHAGVAIWPTGEQALANVTRLIDLARRAERHGVTSFRGFVDRLTTEAERGEASEAPIVEEGTEGVRIMTVHRAKGLEFPVVILADLTAKEAPGEPSRYIDASRGLCAMRIAGCSPPELLEHRDEEREREREEAARILYVAATRARDLLVVPVVGDERREGWLAALHPVVYPDESRRRQPETATPTGCPRFGLDSVRAARRPRARPRALGRARDCTRPRSATHRVVWWDPATLALDVEETVGLRQQKLLEADESGATSERGVQAHARWQATRAEVRAAAERPSVTVESATLWAAARAAAGDARRAPSREAAAEVAVERASGGGGDRPHGVALRRARARGSRRASTSTPTPLRSRAATAAAGAPRRRDGRTRRTRPRRRSRGRSPTPCSAAPRSPNARVGAVARSRSRSRSTTARSSKASPTSRFATRTHRRRGRSSTSRPIASSVAAYRSIAGSSGSTRKRWRARPGTPLAPSCCTLPRRPRRPASLLRGARDPACSISASLVRSDARTARSSGAAGAAARS